ncbi:MAG TPA: glycosyltransferase family 4 protein [Terriglobales bacterium]|nr:glycosyltransferase family 4 protein [Terriglobales bacterium]
MPTIAYLANQFPSQVEPYVPAEIRELRRRGFKVIPGSARFSSTRGSELKSFVSETVYLQSIRLWLLVRAAGLCLRKSRSMADLFSRVLMRGTEGPGRRVRALFHTWLGAYYALLLEGRGVDHIHVHHGYFASWIAMVASRLLGITFSMTLHGSDLLLHKAYLDSKLQNCSFCVTVSEFNRQHILEHFPNIRPDKVVVQRLGIAPLAFGSNLSATHSTASFLMLAVGRLNPIKDHAFLVRACGQLKARGLNCLCLIAGEGAERARLERLIKDLDLQEEVELLGHLSRRHLDSRYRLADLVVLTSRSEGIPLVLMEAMAHAKVVLAPNITGIPELVLDGRTGFLYRAGTLDDFVSKVEMIHKCSADLAPISRAAQQHVSQYFDRNKNLAAFGDLFLARMSGRARRDSHENPILQQI